MSLSGSIAFLLYYLTKAFFGRYLSASCQYLLLKICMCFFLLPIPLLSEEIRVKIRMFFPEFTYGIDPAGTWIDKDFDNLIYNTPEGYVLPGFSWQSVLALAVWLAVAAGILLFQYKNYRKIRRLTKQTTVPSARLNEASRQIGKSMKLRRAVTAYSLDARFSPFCYGLFTPRVLLPSDLEPEESELVLRHELQHIKSFDFLFRLVALLIMALHFFNPLAYLLAYETGKACELACDEKVTKNFSEEQLAHYMHLLVNIVVYSPFQAYTNSFSGNSQKTIKERIFMMKHPHKTKLAVLICCMMFTVLFSTLPAAAYEFPQVEKTDSYDPDTTEVDYMFTTSDTSPYEEETDPNEIYFRTSDYFFIDEEGNLFSGSESSSIAPQSSCSHTYVSGYLYEHAKNSKGGCTYTKYSAKRCSKCGAIKDKTRILVSTYDVCPHK